MALVELCLIAGLGAATPSETPIHIALSIKGPNAQGIQKAWQRNSPFEDLVWLTSTAKNTSVSQAHKSAWRTIRKGHRKNRVQRTWEKAVRELGVHWVLLGKVTKSLKGHSSVFYRLISASSSVVHSGTLKAVRKKFKTWTIRSWPPDLEGFLTPQAAKEKPGGRAGTYLEMQLWARTSQRIFTYYEQFSDGNLRNFSSGYGAGGAGEFSFFPISYTTPSGQSRWLGFEVSVYGELPRPFAIGADTEPQGFHQMWGYNTAIKMRFDFPLFLWSIAAGYAENRGEFQNASDDVPLDELPDVKYRGWLVSSALRMDFDWLSVWVDTRLNLLLNAGRVGDTYFKYSRVGSLSVRAAIARHLLAGIEIVAGAEYAHYFYAMNSRPGDDYIAGGALDQYVVAFFGLGYALK
jgi:hypothetical protein